MNQPSLYYAVRASTFFLSRDLSLVFAANEDDVIEIDPLAARVLSLCPGCKELEDHITGAMQRGLFTDRGAVAAAISRLVRVGLLRRFDHLSLPELLKPISQQPRRISVVAIITTDRPQALVRCLKSLVTNCSLSDNRPRFIIVDGSCDKDNRTANQLAGSEIARTTPHVVDYVGPVEARALRAQLATSGVPESTLRFGLSAGAIGANRNIRTRAYQGRRSF